MVNLLLFLALYKANFPVMIVLIGVICRLYSQSPLWEVSLQLRRRSCVKWRQLFLSSRKIINSCCVCKQFLFCVLQTAISINCNILKAGGRSVSTFCHLRRSRRNVIFSFSNHCLCEYLIDWVYSIKSCPNDSSPWFQERLGTDVDRGQTLVHLWSYNGNDQFEFV